MCVCVCVRVRGEALQALCLSGREREEQREREGKGLTEPEHRQNDTEKQNRHHCPGTARRPPTGSTLAPAARSAQTATAPAAALSARGKRIAWPALVWLVGPRAALQLITSHPLYRRSFSRSSRDKQADTVDQTRSFLCLFGHPNSQKLPTQFIHRKAVSACRVLRPPPLTIRPSLDTSAG